MRSMRGANRVGNRANIRNTITPLHSLTGQIVE